MNECVRHLTAFVKKRDKRVLARREQQVRLAVCAIHISHSRQSQALSSGVRVSTGEGATGEAGQEQGCARTTCSGANRASALHFALVQRAGCVQRG